MKPTPLDRICAAAREHGMQYGDYVAAGMPGYEDGKKPAKGSKEPHDPDRCAFCGGPLPSWMGGRKYCSEECRYRAGYARKKSGAKDRKCLLCGKAIPEGSRSDIKYCSKACRDRAFREREKAGHGPQAEGQKFVDGVLVCADCGKPLQHRNGRPVRCPACSDARNRAKSAERSRLAREKMRKE